MRTIPKFLHKLLGRRHKHQLELLILGMNDLRQNWDFEVVSKTYVDNQDNEFVSFDDYFNYWAYQALKECVPVAEVSDYFDKNNITCFSAEDLFEAEKCYCYGGTVDIEAAKKCRFGTVRMLKGLFKDKHFMFPIIQFDIDIQLFAYAVLAYGFIDTTMAKHIRDKKNHQYFTMVLGDDTFAEVLQKIADSEKKLL